MALAMHILMLYWPTGLDHNHIAMGTSQLKMIDTVERAGGSTTLAEFDLAPQTL